MSREARAELEALQQRARELREALESPHSSGFADRLAALRADEEAMAAHAASVVPFWRQARAEAERLLETLRMRRKRLQGAAAQKNITLFGLLLVTVGGVASCYTFTLMFGAVQRLPPEVRIAVAVAPAALFGVFARLRLALPKDRDAP